MNAGTIAHVKLSVYSSLIVVQVKNLQLSSAQYHILCSGGSYTSDQNFELIFFSRHKISRP